MTQQEKILKASRISKQLAMLVPEKFCGGEDFCRRYHFQKKGSRPWKVRRIPNMETVNVYFVAPIPCGCTETQVKAMENYDAAIDWLEECLLKVLL